MTPRNLIRILSHWHDELAPNGKGKQLKPTEREGLYTAIGVALQAAHQAQPKPRPRHPSNLGTANQAIQWALHVNTDGQEREFIAAWQDGDVSEWPEYLLWLDQQEENVGTLGGLLDPAIGREEALRRLGILTNGQLAHTSCGTGFLASERAMRFIEHAGWPTDPGMLDWLTNECCGAGSGFNLLAVTPRLTITDDDLPF